MKFIIGKVLHVKVIEQKPKDWGKGKGPEVSYLHQISISGKIDGGETVHNISVSKFDKAAVQIVPDGASVKVVYNSKDGKADETGKIPQYHNAEKIEILEVVPPKLSNIAKEATATTNEFDHQVTKASSKDVSMEVSGLLQALIGSGLYNPTDEIIDLENDLRKVLDLKRRVAKDYE